MIDRIAHAKSYPFPIPSHGYLFAQGTWRPLDGAHIDRTGCTPVLAAGSNQSPEQLARKYQGHDGVEIAAERGVLRDFDVVYAAHLSGYSSVPATFQASPGTAVTVFVLWLDDRALRRMHETEGNYTYDALAPIRVELEGAGGTLASAFAYSSRVGCLNIGGACAALAAIPATGRRFAALSEETALTHARDRLALGMALDDFIAGNLADNTLRLARSKALGADALPLAFPRTTIAAF
ncbi:MAG: hypothetical protein FJX67_13250 [Alphaproteobacteria bacterium]|nr:hypothetical protein [Alphaproteobacteria bacterium]